MEAILQLLIDLWLMPSIQPPQMNKQLINNNQIDAYGGIRCISDCVHKSKLSPLHLRSACFW